MDVKAGNCCLHEKKPFEALTPNNEAKKPVGNNSKTPVFVNHAANAWQESRKKWIGDLHQRSKGMEKDPIISWSKSIRRVGVKEKNISKQQLWLHHISDED